MTNDGVLSKKAPERFFTFSFFSNIFLSFFFFFFFLGEDLVFDSAQNAFVVIAENRMLPSLKLG